MITPKELLRIARNINPQKLESDPQAALEDAYIVAEAFRLAEMEKASIPNYLPPREVTATLYLPKKKKAKSRKAKSFSTIDNLRLYLEKNAESVYKISEKLKIGSGTIYNWLNGKHEPTVDNIAKIEAFLHDAEHRE
jgi:hypothetical protein